MRTINRHLATPRAPQRPELVERLVPPLTGRAWVTTFLATVAGLGMIALDDASPATGRSQPSIPERLVKALRAFAAEVEGEFLRLTDRSSVDQPAESEHH